MAMYDNPYSNRVNELVTEMVRVLGLNDAEYSVGAGRFAGIELLDDGHPRRP